MKVFYFFIFIYFVFLATSCKNGRKDSSQYKLSQVLAIDTPKVSITYQNDSLIEVRDYETEIPSGSYTFDGNENLRFYGFFVTENQYRYSEQYDVTGNLIKVEGTPLTEYRVSKLGNDSIRFVGLLYSLNKKYEGIEIISNFSDTIYPNLLYKTNAYSNMKCFSFKLGSAKILKNLVLYTKIVVTDTVSKVTTAVTDTTDFTKVKL